MVGPTIGANATAIWAKDGTHSSSRREDQGSVGTSQVTVTRTSSMATTPAQNTWAMRMVAPASEVVVKELAVPVSELGPQEQMEVVAEGITMKAGRARIRETGGAAMAHTLEDAAGHLTDGTSGDIGEEMLS